jgi:MSHA biogenesis protein MshL
MPNELKSITSYLKASQNAVERQVLIEARILEVTLKDGYETGVNWAAFFAGSGRAAVGQLTPGTNIGSTGSGVLQGGTSAPLTATLANTGAGRALASAGTAAGTLFGVAVQARNFAALMTFLQTQGVVHTLSSPRIATMNNQKAVLKVGSDSQFITKITGGTLNTGTGVNSQSSPTFESQSFFSGIALDVTPQIGEDGNILLHVRPSISDVTQRLSTLDLGGLGQFTIPLVSNTISETDSVIRAQDTQIVAIGGLMRTAQSENRNQVPGLGSASFFGSLFRNTAQASEKRELVILIKPTIVQSDESWARDITNTRERVQGMQRGFSWGGRAEVFGTEAEGDRR